MVNSIKKIKEIQTASVAAMEQYGINNGPRRWALSLMNFTEDMLFSKIRQFFDRTELNKKYAENAQIAMPNQPKPYSFLHMEIDYIYSYQKSTIQRHRNRLSFYRSDLSNKLVRTPGAVDVIYATREYMENLASQKMI